MTEATITITYAQLKAHRACADQLALFKERFGDSVTVTRDDAGDKAQGFDIDWLAITLLSAPLLAEYETHCEARWAECARPRAALWRKYERQRAALWRKYERPRAELLAKYERQRAELLAECERQCAELLAGYERQRVPLWRKYERERAELLAEYDRQRALLLAEYDRQRAIAFFDLYATQLETVQ